MMSCWEKDPEDRPTFDELEKTLSRMYLDALKNDEDADNNDQSTTNVGVNEAKLRDSKRVNLADGASNATGESESSSGYDSPV